MIKIKPGKVLLTLAAVAALLFLLPTDKEAGGVPSYSDQTISSQPRFTQKTKQRQFVGGHALHSA
jgi:hypothetical protein